MQRRLQWLLAVSLSPFASTCAAPVPTPHPPSRVWVAPWSTPAPATGTPTARASGSVAPSPALATASDRRGPPRLTVRLLTAEAVAEGRLVLELRDGGGRKVWSCERAAPLSEGALDDACPVDGALAAGAGSYLFEASLHGAGALRASASQSLPITLEELALEIEVSLAGGDAPRLEELAVRRVLASRPEMRLHREWSATRTDLPLRYTLLNGGRSDTVYAPGMQGIVIGQLDARAGDRWVPHARALLCNAPHGSVPLAPGAMAVVEEGHYLGPLRSLPEGRYRMRVRYTLGAPSQPGPARLLQVYEISDELRIVSDRLEPVEDIRDPFACDPPYRIDADSVRRIKPECLGY